MRRLASNIRGGICKQIYKQERFQSRRMKNALRRATRSLAGPTYSPLFVTKPPGNPACSDVTLSTRHRNALHPTPPYIRWEEIRGSRPRINGPIRLHYLEAVWVRFGLHLALRFAISFIYQKFWIFVFMRQETRDFDTQIRPTAFPFSNIAQTALAIYSSICCIRSFM